MDQLAGVLGTDRSTTEKAVGAALPALIGGLAKNAMSSPDGAASLASALDRDHDGSLLDNIGPLLGALGGQSSGGGLGGALGGLLGGKSRGGVLGGLLGRKSRGGALGGLLGGDSGGGFGGLLGQAAGAVLGGSSSKASNGAGILKHVLGGRQGAVENAVGKASGMDAAQVGKLLMLLAPMVMGALGKVKKERNLDAGALAGLLGQEKEELTSQAPGVGGLMGLLDSDGDGSITDDLASIGSSLLKNYLK